MAVYLVSLAMCTLGSLVLETSLYSVAQAETVLKHRPHNDSAILRD